ncbi:MAG: hypothetical protein R2912_05005 [Eubacteriales bacterium]
MTERLEQEINAPSRRSRRYPCRRRRRRGLVTYLKNPFNDFIDSILNVIDTDATRAGREFA